MIREKGSGELVSSYLTIFDEGTPTEESLEDVEFTRCSLVSNAPPTDVGNRIVMDPGLQQLLFVPVIVCTQECDLPRK